jgi:hypothetical protein
LCAILFCWIESTNMSSSLSCLSPSHKLSWVRSLSLFSWKHCASYFSSFLLDLFVGLLVRDIYVPSLFIMKEITEGRRDRTRK